MANPSSTMEEISKNPANWVKPLPDPGVPTSKVTVAGAVAPELKFDADMVKVDGATKVPLAGLKVTLPAEILMVPIEPDGEVIDSAPRSYNPCEPEGAPP